MKGNMGRFIAIVGIGLALMMPLRGAFADDSNDFKKLSADWWQWALSIPTSVNALTDTTGEHCMVGQQGEKWFLAGFFGTGSAIRTCSVPASTQLYFPVVNSVAFNTPGLCGSPAETVAQLRKDAAAFIDGVTDVSAELDGAAIKNVDRSQSEVFPLVLPEDNVFDSASCDVPGGIYSPAVDDGYFVLLKPLTPGSHTLHFQASNGGSVVQDVTYNLLVVPAILK